MAQDAALSLDVLVIGSLHLDLVVNAPHLPALDETVRSSGWQKVCGGKGGNQACWSARLGARTALVSRVGRDDFGDMLLENLTYRGVNAEGVAIDDHTRSGKSVAILDANGDYGAVIVSGANLAITPEAALHALAQLGAPKILVLQNEIEDAINAATDLFQTARMPGLPFRICAQAAETLLSRWEVKVWSSHNTARSLSTSLRKRSP
jgi:ribokinase